MKKALSIITLMSILFIFAACGAAPVQSAAQPSASTAQTQPAETAVQPSAAAPEVVAFTDEVLEELVRKAMNKPSGDILVAEAQTVTELKLEMEGDKPIPRVKDLSGIAQFPNLTFLNLNWALNNDGKPFDLSPLAGLTKLEYLYICCDNISDISPLKGLINMKDLWIWGNGKITDISALSGMTKMESLWIKGNQITDIRPLSGMAGLVYLYMEENMVTDLSPLAGLTKLKSLLLKDNPATDYSPLKDIYPNLEEKDFKLK